MVYTVGTVDVKEYISSGILESVVFGLATDQEIREVACMSHIYPEIRAELDAISAAFEKETFAAAIEPDPSLKSRVIEAIRNEEQIIPEEEQPKIIPFETAAQTTAPAGNPWKWMAAACAIMMLGAGLLWYTSTQENQSMSNKIAQLEKENTKSQEVYNAMVLQQERTEAIQKVLTDESTQNVKMGGMPKDPKADVKIMWSGEAQKAVMIAQTITPPPTDMQYQLWAIADGKPVSIGLFDYDELMSMTEPFDVYAKNISAFAITLEKRGGNPVPTMENMVVMGAIGA